MGKYINKINNRLSYFFNKKSHSVDSNKKIISFTFDDAPSSAFRCAGDILMKHKVNGTYYVALSFLGDEIGDGKLYTISDLLNCIKQGHEIGCHTFNHTSSFNVSTNDYLKDIHFNSEKLNHLDLNVNFNNFSYPFGEITPKVKAKISHLFRSCRGIRQGVNIGEMDLNNLKSVRLYEKTNSLDELHKILAEFNESGGWLVFYTHDIQDDFSEYGCSPTYFKDIVENSIKSGAKIMTVNEALSELNVP